MDQISKYNLAHRIKLPISKLWVLNFHEFYNQSDLTKNKQIKLVGKFVNEIGSSDSVTTNPQTFPKKWMVLLKSTVHKNYQTISVSQLHGLVFEKTNLRFWMISSPVKNAIFCYLNIIKPCTVKSRAVYPTIQFWTIFGVLLTETCY